MSTTEKTAIAQGFFSPSADQVAQHESALNRYYGENILKTLGATAGIGAGATALYHLMSRLRGPGKKEKKYVGYGSGSPIQAKVALDMNSVNEFVGSMLPKTWIPGGLPNMSGGAAPSDPSSMRRAWGAAATIGASGLGLWGGKKLVDHLAQKKKKQDMEDELEAAKQDYYSALSGGKTAGALDAAFEKSAILGVLGDAASAVYNTPQAVRTAYLIAMLGAGGIGAKYMYDRTKARTDGENLAKAQASRARTKGLPPIWVDPQSLSDVKALAGSHE